GETVRRPGELLTEVSFPALPRHSATAFLKAGRRRAMEISVVCVAARITLDGAGGQCLDARLALGAVGPRAMRAREAERLLAGQTLTGELIGEAGQAAAAECRPISDVRASARYRRLLTATLVMRVLARCLERIATPEAQ